VAGCDASHGAPSSVSKQLEDAAPQDFRVEFECSDYVGSSIFAARGHYRFVAPEDPDHPGYPVGGVNYPITEGGLESLRVYWVVDSKTGNDSSADVTLPSPLDIADTSNVKFDYREDDVLRISATLNLNGVQAPDGFGNVESFSTGYPTATLVTSTRAFYAGCDSSVTIEGDSSSGGDLRQMLDGGAR
jgi:hypothetical protein